MRAFQETPQFFFASCTMYLPQPQHRDTATEPDAGSCSNEKAWIEKCRELQESASPTKRCVSTAAARPCQCDTPEASRESTRQSPE